MRSKTKHLVLVLFLFLSLLMLVMGCDRPFSPGGTKVWIDVPVNGRTIPEGTEVEINGHASSPEGLSRVEIWINGTLEFTLTGFSSEEDLSRFTQTWTPPGPGEYTIQAIAVGIDGTLSEPGTTRIYVGSDSPTPVVTEVHTPTHTPVSTLTPTPTTPPEVVIDFWAEPSTIVAGGSFTLYWHVENVDKVIFGGVEQGFDGSYTDSLCENARYTLTVIHTDGSEEQRVVDIEVEGSCATATFTPSPSPEPDTTPPSAPTPLKPLNEADLGCTSNAMLRWTGVTDESGIAQYQVEFQHHPGDNNWEHTSGSPTQGISEENLEVNLECGFYYRWRVRAVDGNGNVGNWSVWFTFTVPLG